MNRQFLKIPKSYLFSEIEKRSAELKKREPDADIVNLGIGDVALPLSPVIQGAFKDAIDEMGARPIGYGPEIGYPFLREKLVEVEYGNYGFTPNEIFITDGINPAICYVSDLFDRDVKVGIQDPTYPLYRNLSILAGRETITTLPCTEDNRFVPAPPKEALDLVYLCSPSNPTGVAMTRDDLRGWVDYAKKHGAILIFDAAYESFIRSKDVPRSIYEIDGAREVALEFRSFSKSAGFTGLRLGYLVLPKETGLLDHFRLRQEIKTNGVSYPVQRAGMAALSDVGQTETAKQVDHYLKTAKAMKTHLEKKGYTCYGGGDSPYIWWKIQGGDSWSFFDHLLNTFKIITIPGAGFGKHGEGFLRLSCFLNQKNAVKAMERIGEL